MSCVPTTEDFTPCQKSALAMMTPQQKREFARDLGLLHRLEELEKLNTNELPRPVGIGS